MTKQEYEVYKKQHPYEDVIGTEEGKINQEKASFTQYRRKSKRRMKEHFRDIVHQKTVSWNEMDEVLDLPEEEYISVRVLRNAGTHKRRLRGLRKRES